MSRSKRSDPLMNLPALSPRKKHEIFLSFTFDEIKSKNSIQFLRKAGKLGWRKELLKDAWKSRLAMKIVIVSKAFQDAKSAQRDFEQIKAAASVSHGGFEGLSVGVARPREAPGPLTRARRPEQVASPEVSGLFHQTFIKKFEEEAKRSKPHKNTTTKVPAPDKMKKVRHSSLPPGRYWIGDVHGVTWDFLEPWHEVYRARPGNYEFSLGDGTQAYFFAFETSPRENGKLKRTIKLSDDAGKQYSVKLWFDGGNGWQGTLCVVSAALVQPRWCARGRMEVFNSKTACSKESGMIRIKGKSSLIEIDTDVILPAQR